MMGIMMSETCWAVFKLQAINLRDWCIWLVDLFELLLVFCRRQNVRQQRYLIFLTDWTGSHLGTQYILQYTWSGQRRSHICVSLYITNVLCKMPFSNTVII
jgi:hypothetical protein